MNDFFCAIDSFQKSIHKPHSLIYVRYNPVNYSYSCLYK